MTDSTVTGDRAAGGAADGGPGAAGDRTTGPATTVDLAGACNRAALAGTPYVVCHLEVPARLDPATQDHLAATLDDDERARWSAAPHTRRRHELLVGRALLRSCLGAALAIDPARVALAIEPGGKPILAGNVDPALHASVSHSGTHVAVAVSLQAPVGLDVEVVEPHPERVAGRFFSAPEQAMLHQLPRHQRDAGFFHLWTVKEACTKALGTGMGTPLTLVPASLAEWGTACGTRWRTLHLSPGLAACVALVGDGPPLDEGHVVRLSPDDLAATAALHPA